jgi:hypothetical protein
VSRWPGRFAPSFLSRTVRRVSAWRDWRATLEEHLLGIPLSLTLESAGVVAWDWDVVSGRDVWRGDLKMMFGIDARCHRGASRISAGGFIPTIG